MPGARASKKGKRKKRAFLRAIDDFVTSDAVAKFEVLCRICEEAKETFLDEPLDKYQCPNDQLIDMFSETHPAFALARFCAVLKKNSLAAVLLSKSHELFKAFANDWEVTDELADKEKIHKKAFETIKSNESVTHIVEAVKMANVDARHTIAMFILRRLQDGDVNAAESQSSQLTKALGKKHAILSSWVNFCRNDDQSALGITTMKGLFLLARDSELKEIICDIGGVEGFISRYDRQIERVANYRDIAKKKKKTMNYTIETCAKRKKQVEGTREALQAAEIEAMRGLKAAKLEVKKIKTSLKREEQLLQEGMKTEEDAISVSKHADLAVNDAIVQLVLIIRTIGMLVLGRSELQSKILEYDIFQDLLRIIRIESDELQESALKTLGACADNFTPCQSILRGSLGLETILEQLNDKSKSHTYRVLASNVLYQCIDGNSESGDYVCELGILPGLCQMLHSLYENIHEHEERAKNQEEKIESEAETSKGEEDDAVADGQEESDPLESVECGVRILMTCATSNEKNRNQILSQNVVMPLLELTKSTLVSIVLVSTQCLVNLLDGSSSTQKELVQNGGILILLQLLNRFDESQNLTILRCAAKALYVAIEKYPIAQQMACEVGCVRRFASILKTTSLDDIRMDMCKLIAVATDLCEINQDEILQSNTLKSIVTCCAHSFGKPESRAAAAWAYGCTVEKHVTLKLDGCRIGALATLVELVSQGTPIERSAAAIALSKALDDDLLSKDLTLKSKGLYELINMLKADSEDERCAASRAILCLCKNNNYCVQAFRNQNGLEPLVDMLNVKERSEKEIIECVKCVTVLIVGSLENKEKISAYGGLPALAQILIHGQTENCVQFALIYVTRWAFVKAGQDEFRKQEQGVISRVIELVQSQNELTQRTACHCAYQISKGNFVNQSLLIKGGIVPLLVTMVRPPMSVGSQTASWCIAALGEIAQDDGSREILRNEGAVVALMELGTRAETEYLRRSASEVYAACTTPGWIFGDGTPEFDSQLSISGISSKPWKHGLQSDTRQKQLKQMSKAAENSEGSVKLSGKNDEFLLRIEPPPSMTQEKNSDPNVRVSNIPKFYRSIYCGKEYKRAKIENHPKTPEVRLFKSGSDRDSTTKNGRKKSGFKNKTMSPYLVPSSGSDSGREL